MARTVDKKKRSSNMDIFVTLLPLLNLNLPVSQTAVTFKAVKSIHSMLICTPEVVVDLPQ